MDRLRSRHRDRSGRRLGPVGRGRRGDRGGRPGPRGRRLARSRSDRLELDHLAGDHELHLAGRLCQELHRLAHEVEVAARAGALRNQSEAALLGNHHGEAGPGRGGVCERAHLVEQPFPAGLAVLAERGDLGVGPQALRHHQPGDPGADPVDHDGLVGRGLGWRRRQRRGRAPPRRCRRRRSHAEDGGRVVALDRAPADRPPPAVAGDALDHLWIARRAGGHEADGRARAAGEALGQLALAGAHASDDQVQRHQCSSWEWSSGWWWGTAGAPTLASKPGRATRWTHRSQFMRASPSCASA